MNRGGNDGEIGESDVMLRIRDRFVISCYLKIYPLADLVQLVKDNVTRSSPL